MKTSSTKSAKPKKDVVEASNDGKKKHTDKDELDNKNEFSSGKIYGNEINNDNIAEKKNYQKHLSLKNYSSLKKQNWAFLFLKLD